MALEEFYDRVNQIIFNHLISEDGAIIDEGENNIRMENYGNIRYNYVNSNDWGDRNLAEQDQLIFLNEVMILMKDLTRYIEMYGEFSKPIKIEDSNGEDEVFACPNCNKVSNEMEPCYCNSWTHEQVEPAQSNFDSVMNDMDEMGIN